MSQQPHKFFVTGLALLCALLNGACIDAFEGTKMELLLQQGVLLPGETDSDGFGIPEGTHFEMYVTGNNLSTHLVDFELRPIVDINDPCYIEDQNAFIPFDGRSVHGLHVSMWYDKLLEVYLANDGVISDDEAGALADAQIRIGANGLVGAIQLLQGIPEPATAVKALVATPYGPDMTKAEYDALQLDIDALAATLSPIAADISDIAAAQRRDACEAFFADHPVLYVGADRLITLPLNGTYFGVSAGTDPRTGGEIGGASIDLPVTFTQFDSLSINWQFNDPEDPRVVDYGGVRRTGYHHMAGAPQARTRGVINVPMAHDAVTTIVGEAALFTDLLQDDVHF